mgnify:CR=1 FL=1
MHYAIPCSRRFLLPCIWKKRQLAGSVSIVSKDIRNPLSLPAHNKKAALQLIRQGFHPPDTSQVPIHLLMIIVKMRKVTSLFY